MGKKQSTTVFLKNNISNSILTLQNPKKKEKVAIAHNSKARSASNLKDRLLLNEAKQFSKIAWGCVGMPLQRCVLCLAGKMEPLMQGKEIKKDPFFVQKLAYVVVWKTDRQPFLLKKPY